MIFSSNLILSTKQNNRTFYGLQLRGQASCGWRRRGSGRRRTRFTQTAQLKQQNKTKQPQKHLVREAEQTLALLAAAERTIVVDIVVVAFAGTVQLEDETVGELVVDMPVVAKVAVTHAAARRAYWTLAEAERK
jgi:hypothetical protein